MRGIIDNFLCKMQEVLNADIIENIVTKYIYRQNNLITIRRQAEIRRRLIIDLRKFFNILYYDQNFIVYRNINNDVVLENNYTTNVSAYLYSTAGVETTGTLATTDGMEQIANSVANTQTNLLQTANFDGPETNEIVLFNSTSNRYIDEDGNVVQKKINFNIVYI